MSPNLQVVLEEARKLPADERRELAALILKDFSSSNARKEEDGVKAARAIVAETSGSMAGLDRATLIMLAEDEEYCGY